jgi:hypothetical protein
MGKWQIMSLLSLLLSTAYYMHIMLYFISAGSLFYRAFNFLVFHSNLVQDRATNNLKIKHHMKKYTQDIVKLS